MSFNGKENYLTCDTEHIKVIQPRDSKTLYGNEVPRRMKRCLQNLETKSLCPGRRRGLADNRFDSKTKAHRVFVVSHMDWKKYMMAHGLWYQKNSQMSFFMGTAPLARFPKGTETSQSDTDCICSCFFWPM